MVQFIKQNRNELFRALEISFNQGYFTSHSRVTYRQLLLKLPPLSQPISSKPPIPSQPSRPTIQINQGRTPQPPTPKATPSTLTIIQKIPFKTIAPLIVIGSLLAGSLLTIHSQKASHPNISYSAPQHVDHFFVPTPALELHDTYISDHYLLHFSDIQQSGDYLYFSYRLIRTQDFFKQEAKGYIHLKNSTLHLDGFQEEGKIEKGNINSIKIFFHNEWFI